MSSQIGCSSSSSGELGEEEIEDFVGQEEDASNHDISVADACFLHSGSGSSVAAAGNDGRLLGEPRGDSVKSQDPFIGLEFDSDAAAKTFYCNYAMCLGFGVRVARSRTEKRKGVDVLVMKRFVCLKEGHHRKKSAADGSSTGGAGATVKKKRKRLSIREGCPAMMEVVRRGPERWAVTKLVLDHSHPVVSPDQVREFQLRRLSSKYQEHENRLREMRRSVFVDGDAQILLNYFKSKQAVSPGFFYSILVDGSNCFTNAFWVHASARVAYADFGDAVTLDTTCSALPFVAFTGVDHHGKAITFGAALLMDRSESSFTWLFETWLTAMMSGRQPISLTTDHGKAIGAAVAKVLPQSLHRICRWRVFSRCKRMLPDVYSQFPSFPEELRKCVNESDTIEVFELNWQVLIDKYDLHDNALLPLLYAQRRKWVPAYLTGSFFAELSTTTRGETVSSFHRKHFSTKASLLAFISLFDEEMDRRLSDHRHVPSFSERVLKTGTLMEKQAVEMYTVPVFEKFREELVESFNHFPLKIQDMPYNKFAVERVGASDACSRHVVVLEDNERRAWCNCFRLAFTGFYCRHVLSVFFTCAGNTSALLPEHCFMKRWTRRARCWTEHQDERDVQNTNFCRESPALRYNDLTRDAMKCAERGGALSAERFKVAEEVMRRALVEITALHHKNLANSGGSS